MFFLTFLFSSRNVQPPGTYLFGAGELVVEALRENLETSTDLL